MTNIVKDNLDWAIDRFTKIENPTEADLAFVSVTAQIQEKLSQYRLKTEELSEEELAVEEHNSKRLGEFMTVSGDPRPHKLCHAHAIVSGRHAEAGRFRAILAWAKMRIDDPHNGCWLPRNTSAKQTMPKNLKNAVPHSRIHRYGYYRWLLTKITVKSAVDSSTLSQTLSDIEFHLQNSSFPSWVMLPKRLLIK